MQAISFNDVPRVLSELSERFAKIENLLSQSLSTPKPDEWFDLDGLCDYHPEKPSKPTVYFWVSQNKIPFHKRGKKLTFLKSEIDVWLKGEAQEVANLSNNIKGA